MFGGIQRLFSRCGKTALVLVLFVGIGLMLHAAVPSVTYATGYEPPDSSWSSAFVNFVGTTLAQIINFLGDGIGSLTLVIIEVIVVNILNYNNFSSSSIVTLGWTLTRDMVNMFAVIVLLILAVKTMIGQTANAWQQHLPRFFLGIVFANFSRTLCGLAVDASQIVMMTFVNALMSIAAGNFAQLMVMPQATTYSSETFQGATEAGVTLVTLAANIANAYMKLLVQVAVMLVILLLAIAFIWRIIVLWIAFIMAPLAAFSWGSKEIVGFLGRLYQEWMGSFVPPLILGPMLAFFLYLALAASSNGNLAKAEAFPEPEKRTTYGQITLEIFESTNFTGLLLAIVFLLMGLKESAKTAAKMGGLAAMALNDKTGKRVLGLGARVSGATVGNVAKLSARGALKAGSLAGSGIQLATNKLTAGRTDAFSSAVRGVGGLAGAAGSVAGAVDKQVGLIPTDVTKMPGYAKNRAAAVAKETGKVASGLGAGLSGAIARNVSNPALASALNAMGPSALLAAGSTLSTQEHHISEAEAKAAKERVSHMTQEEKAARLQQALDGTGEKSVEAMADAQNLKGMLLNDKAFADSFKEASENIEAGSFDRHVGKVLHDLQHEDEAGHLSVDKATWDKARNKYLDLYTHAASGEKVQAFLKSDDFKSSSIRKEAVTNPDVIFALASSVTPDKKDGKFVTRLDQLNDKQKDQVQAASNTVVGSFTADMFTQSTAAGAARGVSASGGNVDDYVRAFSRLEGDGTTLDASTAAALEGQLLDIESDASRAKNFHEDELAAIRKNLVQAAAAAGGSVAGKSQLDASFDTGNTYDAAYNLRDRKKFKSFVREDPSAIRHIPNAALNNVDHDVSKATFDAMSKESFEKMKNMVDAGARSVKETTDALQKMKIVLDAKESKARNGVTEAQVKALLADITSAATALKAATVADRAAREADLQAAKANHEATIAGMDKDAMDKIKVLRNSLEATERYL